LREQGGETSGAPSGPFRSAGEARVRATLVALAVALATASLGLVPGLPGGRWLFALGSLALAPLLLRLGGARADGAGTAIWTWAVGLLAALLAGGAVLLLAGGGPRWLGWPASAWATLVAFWIGPWLILGVAAARGSGPTRHPGEESDGEGGDAAR
jgi:hypothetical protein